MYNSIIMVSELWDKYKELIKYCIIGCCGALLDFIAYTILVSCFGINYLIANALSVTVGITNNYFLNAYLNFKVTDNLFKRFLSFYIVGMIGLLISEALLYMLVDIMNINSIISKIITIFVITIIQFLLNKTITFKKKKEEA